MGATSTNSGREDKSPHGWDSTIQAPVVYGGLLGGGGGDGRSGTNVFCTVTRERCGAAQDAFVRGLCDPQKRDPAGSCRRAAAPTARG